MLFNIFRNKHRIDKADTLSGLTVALALVPEVIACVAGEPPLTGLYAALFIGLITAAFGGRPSMVLGATGALAIVMAPLVKTGEAIGGKLVDVEVMDVDRRFTVARI